MKATDKKTTKKKTTPARGTAKKRTTKTSTKKSQKAARKSTAEKKTAKKALTKKTVAAKKTPKKKPSARAKGTTAKKTSKRAVSGATKRTLKKKSVLKKDELARLKAELLSERNRLIKELENLDEVTRSDDYELGREVHIYSNHMAEYASENEAINTALGLRSIVVSRLNQVNTALERLESGNYGICQRCGRAIQMERLLAKPQALLCVECKRAVEAEQRGQM